MYLDQELWENMFFRVYSTCFKRCAIIVVRKVYLVPFASNIHDKIRMDTEYARLVIEQMEEHNTGSAEQFVKCK